MEREFEAAVDAACKRQGWKRERDEIEVALEDGRHQRVRLEPFEFEDEPLVRVTSGIGPSDHIEPLHLTTALRLNYGLAHGALALRDNQLVLVDTLLEDEPDEDEIEAVVSYLAETADHFERTMFGTDEL